MQINGKTIEPHPQSGEYEKKVISFPEAEGVYRIQVFINGELYKSITRGTMEEAETMINYYEHPKYEPWKLAD